MKRIMGKLQDELHAFNPYIKAFTTVLEQLKKMPNMSELRIQLDSTYCPAECNEGCYNTPSVNEVAAIVKAVRRLTCSTATKSVTSIFCITIPCEGPDGQPQIMKYDNLLSIRCVTCYYVHTEIVLD